MNQVTFHLIVLKDFLLLYRHGWRDLLLLNRCSGWESTLLVLNVDDVILLMEISRHPRPTGPAR